MADLIVIGYDNEFKAEEVRLALAKLQKEHLIELEDAAIVVKDSEGKVKLKQAVDLTTEGALSGGFWGLLIGTLFLNPLLGAAVGAASGALGGVLSDIGVDDDFMKQLGSTLEPGTSALFALVRKVTPDKVLDEVNLTDLVFVDETGSNLAMTRRTAAAHSKAAGPMTTLLTNAAKT